MFVFRVKGGEGGLSVRFCQSKCLVEVLILILNFLVRQSASPLFFGET